MPYISEWVPNEVYLTHRGVPIFYTYEDNEGSEYTYQYGTASDSSDDDKEDDTVFDVRELPTWVEPEHPPYTDYFKDSAATLEEKDAAWRKYFRDGIEDAAIRRAVIAAIEDGSLDGYIKAPEHRSNEIVTEEDAIEDANAIISPSLPSICRNCKHWRDKSWGEKGWGVCDNTKNEIRLFGLSMIPQYVLDKKGADELINELDQGIRYPEEFGCIFFRAV